MLFVENKRWRAVKTESIRSRRKASDIVKSCDVDSMLTKNRIEENFAEVLCCSSTHAKLWGN